MRIDVEFKEGGFRYHLKLDQEDRAESRRDFSDAPEPVRLVRYEYDVILPPSFRTIHPDLHAQAIWQVVRPFVGSSLSLPFAVSESFARFMKAKHGIDFVHVDSELNSRQSPDTGPPGLLLSGGMDSVAASIVLPRNTEHLFLDRIPHLPPAFEDPNTLIDLVHPRALCREMQEDGRNVHILRTDHEFLYRPYPVWHSNQMLLPACYMADTLNLSTINTGDVLDVFYFDGYLAVGEEPEGWRFGTRATGAAGYLGLQGILGLELSAPIMGLTEVGTVMVVNSSRYRRRTASCYYKSQEPFCMRCDKCFKKLLLMHVVEGREVPSELFGQFIGHRHLAEIFKGRYFDWHHIWYYLFQKMRCKHWFAQELHRQAVRGPDLSVLEKWYPSDRELIPESCRVVVEENIARYVDTMTDDEVAYLRTVEVPPLHAPELDRVPSAKREPQREARSREPGEESSTRQEHPKEEVQVDPATARLGARIESLLLPGSGVPENFGGFTVSEVSVNPHNRSVYVTLEGEERPGRAVGGNEEQVGREVLVLSVQAVPGHEEEYYATVGPLGIRYNSSTPLDTPSRLDAMVAFLKYLRSVQDRLCAGEVIHPA